MDKCIFFKAKGQTISWYGNFPWGRDFCWGGGGGICWGRENIAGGGNCRAPLLLYETQRMIIYLVLKHKEGIQQHREEQVRNPDKKKIRVYTQQ